MEPIRKHDKRNLESMPYGALGIVPVVGCEEMGKEIDYYLTRWRAERQRENRHNPAFNDYQRSSYIVNCDLPRFGTGEGKGVLPQSVRGMDLYILVDVVNFSKTYKMFGLQNHMSPDDHYANLKRVIAAAGGKARRITVIMPYLYESRQQARSQRESLDCAIALQELVRMGVDNIITFDAHDPRVQNAIPLNGFDTIQPVYQFIKGLLRNVPDLRIDAQHMLVISPDEGGMKRAVYVANMLNLDMGMFYKRRDYTKIVNGEHPVLAHEFLGSSVEGKDVIIVDDMISSGNSIIDIATKLKERKARRVFLFSTFGLFTSGLDKMDKAYEDGIIDKILTTNLIYQSPELLKRPWYVSCDMGKYLAYIIDTLNHDSSISDLLDPYTKTWKFIANYNRSQQNSGKFRFPPRK